MAKNSGKNHHHFGEKAYDGSGRGNGSYHQTPNQGQVYLKSSYEIAYANYLEQNNVNYWYEVYGFDMNIGFDTIYHPDFFLPEYNKFIEIKGRENYNLWEDSDVSKQKSNKFKELYLKYYDYEVLFSEDLRKLQII